MRLLDGDTALSGTRWAGILAATRMKAIAPQNTCVLTEWIEATDCCWGGESFNEKKGVVGAVDRSHAGDRVPRMIAGNAQTRYQ